MARIKSGLSCPFVDDILLLVSDLRLGAILGVRLGIRVSTSTGVALKHDNRRRRLYDGRDWLLE